MYYLSETAETLLPDNYVEYENCESIGIKNY